MKDKGTLYLVDGSSYIYRSFYAIRGLKSPDGTPTGALYGFLNTLLKVIREKSPGFIAVAFDAKGPTFRHETYPEYKATRDRMPEDLAVQMPLIREAVELMGVASLEEEGYEADDLIATAARWAGRMGLDVVIVSGDKDLMQLIGESVTMLDVAKEQVIDEQEVEKKFGVGPGELPDLFGMVGDSSDNLPGVPGIGPKKGAELLKRFGSLDSIIEHIQEVEPERHREALEKSAEDALLTRRLFLLKDDAPLELSLEKLKPGEPEAKPLASFLGRYALSRVMDELGLKKRPRKESEVDIREPEDPAALLKDAAKDLCALQWFEGRGVALSFEEGKAWLLEKGAAGLAEYLENPGARKAGHDLKGQALGVSDMGIEPRGLCFDAKVAAYLLDPGVGGLGLESVAKRHLGSYPRPPEDADDEAIAALRAEAVFRLAPVLSRELKEHGMLELFREVEMPLLGVLFNMERRGVKVDEDMLADISRDFEGRLRESERLIHRLAKEEFNINSPKQLSEVLFEKLNLTPPRKTRTKSGFYPTDIKVLNALATQHPLPQEVINYRTLSKLKSTYVDALPRLINEETGRIHTTFHQTVTATGRLSSSHPNLQNIPIRDEEGKRIREAFVSEEGFVLVSADYSQIELRVLAHLSGDEVLLEAFERGEDIHRATAQAVYHVSAGDVSPEMRRKAKVINFGLIYGMGPMKLSGELNITTGEAKKIIELYFMRFPGIKKYFDHAVEKARTLGYAETMFGRRRLLPDITSQSRVAMAAAERMAVNTPIQGTAADIIKIAMIRLEEELGALGAQGGMTMQVHDELIVEVEEKRAEHAARLMKETMEGAAELRVPLKVEVGKGLSWAQAH